MKHQISSRILNVLFMNRKNNVDEDCEKLLFGFDISKIYKTNNLQYIKSTINNKLIFRKSLTSKIIQKIVQIFVL